MNVSTPNVNQSSELKCPIALAIEVFPLDPHPFKKNYFTHTAPKVCCKRQLNHTYQSSSTLIQIDPPVKNIRLFVNKLIKIVI